MELLWKTGAELDLQRIKIPYCYFLEYRNTVVVVVVFFFHY